MTAMIFVGLPGHASGGLNDWLVGSGGWTAAPSVMGRMLGVAPGGVNPLGQTMPGANPFPQTQPGANPFA